MSGKALRRALKAMRREQPLPAMGAEQAFHRGANSVCQTPTPDPVLPSPPPTFPDAIRVIYEHTRRVGAE